MSTTAPGWYDDGSGKNRWWDGNAWTENVQEAAAAVTVSARDAKLAALQAQPGTVWSAIGKPMSGIGAGRYRLTEDILFFEKGAISTKAQQIHANEIHDVDGSQTMTQKARGVGTIKLHAIRPSGTEVVLLEDVENFRDGVTQINRIAHEARMRHQQRSQTQYVNHNGSAYAPGAIPVPSPAPAGPAGVDLNSEIAKLAAYHQQGILSDEEFTAGKRKLLGI
ncbi:DUF2510 domain-containing protein [Agreia sp. COWG]|uniref:DUF2510 domain-containing protein n=1 Tax=Agreia sp. COWG TaxID=2773266 RepID=UPI001927B425|nr:DUF2510 domain-containing protein [Agreia sp. COWG]CAD6005309.1 PH (Pleckstrin Homology) domain-containing protein [Agreia sp. COWG]